MHVIVLENQPTAFRGGQHLSLLDVCRGLSQCGHTISLLYEKEGDLLSQYQEFCKHTVNVNGYTIYQKTDIFNRLADIWKINWKIPTCKKSIIYSNQYHDSLFGAVLALSKNIPFVCHLRQCPPEQIPGQWIIGLKGMKQAIVVSNQAKLDWVQSGIKKEKIEVVYNAINTDKFKPAKDFFLEKKQWNIPESTRVISFVGRMDRAKGLETLFKAFALLHQSQPNTKLLIAGKPVREGEEYKKYLEQIVLDLGIQKDVEFLGHVTNTMAIYQVSDVTVLPSLCSEPFGRTIIESMACGTPVVASRTGGIPEILTGEFQSWLSEPGSERDLADTLIQIMNWRDNDPALGKRCREHVLSRFTLDKMIDGIEKILLKAVKK